MPLLLTAGCLAILFAAAAVVVFASSDKASL
jgi:hypothetical protein